MIMAAAPRLALPYASVALTHCGQNIYPRRLSSGEGILLMDLVIGKDCTLEEASLLSVATPWTAFRSWVAAHARIVD
jgi:hypothetical protein